MSEGITKKRVLDKICETCGRSFARNEHLIRHRRIHTSERPFHCLYCQTRFPRADVTEKHMRRFHTAEGTSSDPSVPATKKPRLVQQERTKLACDQCRKKKLKCDNQHPCEACRTRQISCVVSSSSRRPGRPRNDESLSVADDEADLNMVDAPDIAEVSMSWLPGNTDTTTAGSIPMSAFVESTRPDIPANSDPSLSEETPSSHLLSQNPTDVRVAALETAFPSESAFYIDSDPSLLPSWEDLDLMDNIWQLPSMGVENWLDDLDEFLPDNGLWQKAIPSFDKEKTTEMESAIGMMADHFQRRSRASSPTKSGVRQTWYSIPPRLQMYDNEVINILLNFARSHLSATFKIFSTFEATSETSPELCLAMASVGALFSAVDGGTRIAKALYNDARRLHLETALRRDLDNSTFESCLGSAKTFFLLEIYGICSGDKRSHEFVEAFHYNTVESVRFCLQVSRSETDPAKSSQMPLILEALNILESYRVLLLQRPPTFPWIIEPNSTNKNDLQEHQSSSMKDLLPLMAHARGLPSTSGNLQNLAIISSYSWMSSPRGQERLRKRQLWKPEFVELALDNWMQTSSQQSAAPGDLDFSQLLLYHLAHINLYTNLGLLQRYAHEFIKPRGSSRSKMVVDSFHEYFQSKDFQVSLWHAKTMLRHIREAVTTTHRRHQAGFDKDAFTEPPHLPYSIYFATLITWYGESGATGSRSARDTCIETGTKLLYALKVHVSKVLGDVLSELLAEDDRDER